MGRTAVRRVEPHRPRRGIDGVVVLAAAVVLLLALVGLVSAGMFVAGKVSGSSSSSKAHPGSGGTSVAVQDVSRAQAQATAIVSAAQSASSNIVKSATKDANRRATGILASARTRAKKIVDTAKAAAKSQAATAPAQAAAPAQPASPAPPAPATPLQSSSSQSGSSPNTATGASPPAGAPNLGKLPSSWLVVAYNASFGSGPGGVGGVTVWNRGHGPFSGVAVVHYAHGGTARAYFSGLPPGQSAVVPLNGKRYTGGAYTLTVRNVH